MAAVAPAADQASELLQKLYLDSPPKTHDAVEATAPIPAQQGSSNRESSNMETPSNRSPTPLVSEFADPNMFYAASGYATAAYYYGGYEWDLYQGYAYTPYGTYPFNGSSIPAIAHDGQLYGAQQDQYPVPFFQPNAPTRATQTPRPPTSRGEVSTPVAADEPPVPVDRAETNTNGISNGVVIENDGRGTLRSGHQNPSLALDASYGKGGLLGGLHSTGYQDPRFGPGPDGSRPLYSNEQHGPPPTCSLSSATTCDSKTCSGVRAPVAPALASRMYPANRSSGGRGYGYGFNGYGCRVGGRGGLTVDSKHRPRGRGNGLFALGGESQRGIDELNRGPRAGGHFKNQKGVGPTTIAVKSRNASSNEYSSVTQDKERYNREDFPDDYADAKFFVIKSYSEDDVHKSIKYNVWASTAYGNKKLDAGYQEAQGKAGGCPVLLFFSVNTSGQFVGVAEMVGPVDFNKTVEYWQQDDKWIGCFPVKWHIIKDVPNSILKHITLENNDNKPVTNSRDAQEVMLEQGLRMLKIFKEHINNMCVLDDFDFYEKRQNLMRETRTKQQLRKQVWSGGRTCRARVGDEKGGTDGNPMLQSVSVSPDGPGTAAGAAGVDEVGNGVANGVAIVS